jgi:hypothetical protein
MKGAKRTDFIEVIDKSTEELHQKIDMQRYLVTTILGKTKSEKRLHNVALPRTHRELRFREAIKETIEVLEETRKAFKSKRLEALRKKLTQVLIEPE